MAAAEPDSTREDEAAVLLGLLRDRTREMTDLLLRLARSESPSDVPAAVDTVLRILADELQASGLRVRRLKGRVSGGMLYARPAEEGSPAPPFQMLVGHCDTVWPLGTVRDMPVRVAEDTVQGPGVLDMKGGLVQMIHALRALRDLGRRLPARPLVLINSDEEIGSLDSSRHIRRLARLAARAFVLEPAYGSTGKLKTSRKAVGGFTLTIRGRPAHAGLSPEEGTSAILELSHQIQKLFALNDPVRGITVNVGTIGGGLRANVVAPEVRASIDVRVRTLADAAEVEGAIRGLAPVDSRTVILVEGGFEAPPMEPSPRNQALWRQARALGEKLGLDLEQSSVGGASDGNTTSQYTATLDGLGAVGDGAHAVHEYVEIARLPERAALLALLLSAPLEDAAPEEAR